jgi:DnaJ family protein A protein 2
MLTDAGEVKVIRNQGMPSYRHHDFGNLYIKFDVKFPERITGPEESAMTQEQIDALAKVLPQGTVPGPVPPPDAMVEDFTLDDVDPTREQARATGMGGGMDDDDDDMHPGAERVQCASQ